MTHNGNFDIPSLLSNNNYNLSNILSGSAAENIFFGTDPESPYDLNNFDCQYCNTENYIKNESSSIMSINIQSLPAKFKDLCEFILSLKNKSPEIILLQEIWRFPDLANFKLPGYQPLQFKQRTNCQGGGVGIFVKYGINFVIDPVLSVFHERVYESIVGEIDFGNNKKIIVGSAYRPGTKHPDLPVSDQKNIFLDLIANQLEIAATTKKHVFLLGDFNIDALDYDNNQFCSDYINLLFSLGYIQTVTRPTRCTSESATLIDHCITNVCGDAHVTRIFATNLSDHFPILTNIPVKLESPPPKAIKKRFYSDANFELFKSNINNISWEILDTFVDVDQAYEYFLDNFTTLHDIYFPVQTLKFNKNCHKIEPWFSSALLVSRREKLRLDRLASNFPTDHNMQCYKNYRNVYNRILRAAKKNYYETKLKNCQSNAKATWQTIKQAINMKNKKDQTSITKLNIGNMALNNGNEIVTALNEFFIAAPLNITQQINRCGFGSEDDFNSPGNGSSFDIVNKPISHEEIFSAIKLLEPKKTCDFNNISMFLIKKCVHQIYLPLATIFNLSFSTGIFPQQMKIAKIVPIFKGGDAASPDNYRPISLLSNFSKILEKIMAGRFTTYLEENDILAINQYGFRRGHSTVHPMTLLDNFVVGAFNKRQHAIAVFCDLRKAFDTVHHGKLLKKLRGVGVGALALSWFKSYLSNRKQFVQMGEYSSTLLDIIMGVPQGSILGPILFLIYINDLPECTLLMALLFADDTTLLASHEDPVELYRLVNIEFKKVTDYFRKNLLAIHPAKTKYIFFTSNRNIDVSNLHIYVDNNNGDQLHNPLLKTEIERITGIENNQSIRFLGLYLDPNLNYNSHVQHIAKKISTSLYFLRCAKNLLTKNALKLAYYSLVHSHLIYAIQVWASCSQSNISTVFKLQKSAIRIITGSKYNAHTQPLFKELEILPLPDLIEFFRLQFMQRFSFGMLPRSFVEIWTTNAARAQQNLHNYPLRNSDNLFIPPARLTSIEKHPFHILPKIWSDFNEPSIKFIRNKAEFNQKLKTFLLKKIPSQPSCTRLFCPSCHLTNT